MKFHVGDNVVVTTGKDRGKTGVIGKIFANRNQVWIDGVNQKLRNIKARGEQPGERVSFSAPIEASNVAIVDPKSGKPTRVGVQIKDGKKTRIAKASGQALPEHQGKVQVVATKDEKKKANKKVKTIKA